MRYTWYRLEEFFSDNVKAAYDKADKDKKIRLISLKSWSFSSADAKNTFAGRLQNLNQSPQSFRLPDRAPKADNSDKTLIDNINARLKEGKILLPHYLREGSTVASWYRGPLLPTTITAPAIPTPPQKASDYLLEYDSSFKIMDASYATAWELGRQLMLENKAISVQLYKWRRNHMQTSMRMKQQQDHLPLAQASMPAVKIT